eukprot:6384199-Ditylum_brightwellii.AAC.1
MGGREKRATKSLGNDGGDEEPALMQTHECPGVLLGGTFHIESGKNMYNRFDRALQQSGLGLANCEEISVLCIAFLQNR